jgi:hypothetical protein
MASPFHIFRKHQKAMMVVVGVLCMIGFSVAGVIDYSSDRYRGGGPDQVVATAYEKNIHASEVQQMMRRRQIAISFLDRCQQAMFNLPENIDEQNYYYYMQLLGRYPAAAMLGDATEKSVVQTWIMDERARQMGLVVNDDAINAYLKSYTSDKVKSDAFRSICARLGVGQLQVFEALRAELLALRLQEMALTGLQTPPAQRWDYYRRQRERATVELVPVPVEDFIGDVADPPDEELRAFFDAHKEQLPDPESPVPGFKVPKKASFDVVLAKYDDFYDPSSVTEDEVNEHYEKFKDTRYLWEQYTFDDDADEEDSASQQKSPADNSGETAADKTSTEADNGDTTKADAKGDEKPPGNGDKSSDGEPQSSWMRARDPIASLLGRPWAVVGGLLAADDAEATSDDKQTDQAAKAESDAGDIEKPAVPTKSASSDEASATEKTTTGDKAMSKKTKRPAVPPPITDEYTLPRDIRQGAHPKHAPLWKVEDSIRKDLARDKASNKMEEAFRVVREKMRAHTRLLGPDDTELKMPDLEKVAKAQNLSVFRIRQLTELDLKKEYPDLAQAYGEQASLPFSYTAYRAMGRFQSTTVQDPESNRYLVWKTEEEDEYKPEFADVKSKVLRVWKITKARDLAVKKAKELAEQANKAQKPLKELFADRTNLPVIRPPAFSWLTRGSAGVDRRAPLSESEVEGVDSPGPDFMREVFSLGAGAAGEAMNKPQTIAYVVRVDSLEPSREVLRVGFMAEPFPFELAREDMQNVRQAWIKGIEDEARLTWKERRRDREKE